MTGVQHEYIDLYSEIVVFISNVYLTLSHYLNFKLLTIPLTMKVSLNQTMLRTGESKFTWL